MRQKRVFYNRIIIPFFYIYFRFNSIEKENAALGDLQKYLKPKRDLWLPKEGCKEVEKGVWSETYLKKLHESLKV